MCSDAVATIFVALLLRQRNIYCNLEDGVFPYALADSGIFAGRGTGRN